MLRATLIAAVDNSEEFSAMDSWLNQWRNCLTFISEDTGCGCCVSIIDVEGPDEAIRQIPANLRASSEWSQSIINTDNK